MSYPIDRKCNQCGSAENKFRINNGGNRKVPHYTTICIVCEALNNKIYYYKNKEKRIASTIRSRRRSAESIKRVADYDKNYREINKDILRKKANVRRNARRKNDPAFKLRISISSIISTKLNGGKTNNSCLNYLSYTIEELKKHLESLFEPWMNWNNHGKYNSKFWNDNDFSTWKWQIDHILPQANLPYKSMEDENFKKCWALENLRPYSAKQNIMDGITRTRHKLM